MKQQIDVYVKLTFEADANKDIDTLHSEYGEAVITGCQVFADILTAPVMILDVRGVNDPAAAIRRAA